MYEGHPRAKATRAGVAFFLFIFFRNPPPLSKYESKKTLLS